MTSDPGGHLMVPTSLQLATLVEMWLHLHTHLHTHGLVSSRHPVRIPPRIQCGESHIKKN